MAVNDGRLRNVTHLDLVLLKCTPVTLQALSYLSGHELKALRQEVFFWISSRTFHKSVAGTATAISIFTAHREARFHRRAVD